MKKVTGYLAICLTWACLCSGGVFAAEQDLPGGSQSTCQHSYTAIVTAPTCTERGRTTYICQTCGNSYVGDYRDPLGHQMIPWRSREGYQGDVRSICHRGSSLAPENTLIAFELAKKEGYTYVETDVQFTKDGVPVLIHDTTVDRTSNGSGRVADMTYEELRKLDFGGWMGENFQGTILPTFEEFLQLCGQLHLKPYVELKAGMDPARLPELLDLIERYGMEENVTLISFDGTLLQVAGQGMPGIRLGYLTTEISQTELSVAQKLKQYGGEVFLDCSYGAVNGDTIAVARAAEVPIEVWTVNEADWLDTMDSYITGVTSDSLGLSQNPGQTQVRYCLWCEREEVREN